MEPCRRRMKALTVPAPMARPAQRSASPSSWTRFEMISTSSRNVRAVSPSMRTAPSPAAWASAASRAVTLCTTIVYCWRSSSASANRKGSSSSWQNCSSVQKKEVTPPWRPATSGVADGSSRRGGAQTAMLRNGPDGQVEVGVLGPLLVGQLGVLVVEEEEVFALHVEDQSLGVDRLAPQDTGVEEAVEQEGGVTGLGGHARYAADVDVGTLGPVQEVEVQVEGLVVPGQPGGQLPVHLIEEQGLVPGRALRPVDRGARERGDEDLGLEAGGLDQRRPADLGGQDPLLDQEHVTVQRGPLVPSPHLADHAVDLHRPAVGQHPLEGHDVVQLEEGVGADSHPELQRRGVLGPDHPAHGRHRSDRTAPR